MKDLICFALGLFLSGCGSHPTAIAHTDGGLDAAAETGKTYRWNFDGPTLPEKFFVVLGNWDISSNSLLRQSGRFQKDDFPRIIVKDLTFSNVRVKARCRPESGEIDQACGLMFRAKDSSNYYMTRANALENNVRLYRIVNDKRETLGSHDISVKKGEWHSIEVRAVADELRVMFNGTNVLSAKDPTFSKGKVGFWTKADSVTDFDDLEAEAIAP